jgi:ABC-type transport system substrate-binding protein
VVPHEVVAQFGSAFNAHPVGTGPYRLTNWRRGIKMRFERNPFYARPERQYLDAIDVLIGGDTTLHLMMFEHGELDLADCTASPGIPEADFIRISHTPRWHNLIERMEAGVMDYMVLNTEMKPFDDVRVRQAMNYAVDKDKLVRLHHGMAAPAKGILPSTMPGFNPNLVGYSFDPAKARRLLAASGHADGFSFKLWCWNSPQDMISASAIAYDLAQVGIQAQINLVTFSTLVDSMERRGVVQGSVSAWSQDYPDPSDFLDVMFNGTRITDEGCQNNAFFNNPKVNQLLAEAATCQDPERRLEIYQSVEQTVVDEAPYVFLYQPYIYALHQPWLHGVNLHPVLYFRFERMWLDR